jgi:hypothetical protein
MKIHGVLWLIGLSGMLVVAGCASTSWDRSYYGPGAYYESATPYYGGLHDSRIAKEYREYHRDRW